MRPPVPEETYENICLTEEFTEQCEKMTIRNGSSLAMDSHGTYVTVEYPNGRDELTTRFSAHAGNPHATDVYREGLEFQLFQGQQPSRPRVAVAEHVDEWCKVAKAGFQKIVVDVTEWSKNEEYDERYTVASCSHLLIYSNEESTVTRWIRRIDNGAEKIEVKPAVGVVYRRFQKPETFSRQFAQLEQWSNPSLREFVLMHWVPFTDDEFLSFRAPWFEIMSPTISDEAINKYLHMWSSGELRKSRRFGVCLNRDPDPTVIMKGLLVVPWDREFRDALPHLAITSRSGETRYTVFRTVRRDIVDRHTECSNATLYFDSDQSVYLEVTKNNWDHESSLNESQRERATVAD